MSKYCTNCGKKLGDGKFCVFCGAKIPVDNQESHSKKYNASEQNRHDGNGSAGYINNNMDRYVSNEETENVYNKYEYRHNLDNISHHDNENDHRNHAHELYHRSNSAFSMHDVSSKLTYIFNVYIIAAALFILTLLLKWFKCEIPYLGDYKVGIFDFPFRAISWVDEVGDDVLPLVAVSWFMFVIGVAIIVSSIMTIAKAVKKNEDSRSKILIAAYLNLFLGIFSIIFIFIIKIYISNVAGEWGSLIGGVLDNIITTTVAPIFAIIVSVACIILTKKYINSNSIISAKKH